MKIFVAFFSVNMRLKDNREKEGRKKREREKGKRKKRERVRGKKR